MIEFVEKTKVDETVIELVIGLRGNACMCRAVQHLEKS